MNHIDEGTIHAWIDGALSAEQAREVEAHVAQCATCSASAAEARGLVAASSRILSALDDVPANVTPKKAPAKAPKRQWRAARWVTGIAALLLAAVVLRTSRGVQDARIDQAPTRPETVATVSAKIVDDCCTKERPVTQARLNEIRDSIRREALARMAEQSARHDSRSLVAERFEPVASAPVVGRAAGGAGAAAPSLAIADTAKATVAATDLANRDRSRTADVAAMAPQPSPLLRAPATLNRVPELADSAFAGCYATLEGTRKGLLSAAAEVASEVGRARRTAKTPAAAPAAAAQREAVTPSVPPMVLLDTIVQSAGYLARDAKTGASVGWWRRTTVDSVRIDLLNGAVVAVKRGDRTTCPQR